MTPLEAIDISRDALWVLLKIGAPVMLTALIVGLIIALFQALTQIQEMTLTFVPKIIAIFFVLMLALPFMFQTLEDYYQELMARVSDPDRVADIPIQTDKNKPVAPKDTPKKPRDRDR